MTNCEIISGTYFDEDNGEYLSYGIAAEEDGEKIVVEDISVNRKLVEELRDRILKYGLSLCHLKEYIYDWLCEVTDVLRSA
ncbi:MAG: hypothetical protein KH382_03440 [Clostridiales bacterium]|nr:hypothetical protein [Clostridiales bacterium]